jgi:hypothetical protein
LTKQFIVQRAVTGEVLTYEATGLTAGPITEQLSAVGSLTLGVDVSTAVQAASDGLPLLQEWGSIVTVVEAGAFRFRGIVIRNKGGALELASMATYPHGTPWEGPAFYGAKVDPANLVRMLWEHVQSFPDSDLGVTVVGSTPVRIGSYSTQNKADTLAAYNAAVKTYNAENAKLKQLRDVVAASRRTLSGLVGQRTNASKALTAAKSGKPRDQVAIDAAQNAVNQVDAAKAAQNRVIADQQADVDAQARVVAAAKAAKDKRSAEKTAASKTAKDDGGAYTLLPSEAPDCGREIDDLASSVPFDWREEHYWDGDRPATRIVIAYPRAGRRLSGDGDPTFQQGVNITEALVPEMDGDAYANSVYGVGAGEGLGAIRRSITKRDGRLRRVASLQSKDIKTAASMDARLRVELTARQQQLEVRQITVSDHINSPRGSYSLGDDIYVQGNVPHFGQFAVWHRILGITDNADGTSTIDLARSDSFTYGKGVPE